MVQVRTLENRETPEALALVWDVFLQFEAPDYSQEGIDAFRQSIYDPEYEKKLTLYGAFQDGELLGIAEGSPESWNHRWRISNLCIFQEKHRRCGVATALMEKMLEEAAPMRMAVLETQTCNERAIAFYRKCGFQVIGFDLYAYSNHDPEAHEVRLEMGKKLT